MKGRLIYKSNEFQLEIYRSIDQITVYGHGKNEILRTFNLHKVCNELSYSNEHRIMNLFMFLILLVLSIYELFRYFYLNDPITRQDVATVAFIIAIGVLTYFTNDGFYGWLKFQEEQSESLTISKEEFDKLSSILLNELKNGIPGEISF